MTHKIDILVGENIRGIRQMQGLSQEELAVKVGISYQQLQKYEKAENRISASRLFDVAQALDNMPISTFYNQIARSDVINRTTTHLVNEFNRMKKTNKKLLMKLAKELP